MKRVGLMVFLFMLGLQQATGVAQQNSAPDDRGIIQGLVTREGSAEPLPNVQITLDSGAVDPQVTQSLLTAAAAQGLVITPTPGATLSETAKALSDAATARGLPFGTAVIQNLVTQLGGTKPSVLTDRDGKFSFKDLRPGRYTVRAEREGFFGRAVNGSRPTFENATLAVAGKETKDVALSMMPGAIIAGRIYDSLGQPASNVNVQAFTIGYNNGFAIQQAAIAKVTDDRGEYRLFWIPPGDYALAVTPRAATAAAAGDLQSVKTFFPGVTSINDAKTFAIRGGEDLSGMDISIRAARSFKLSGQVTSSLPAGSSTTATTALIGATLMLVTRDVNLPDETAARAIGNVPLIGSTGKFEVSNILPGEYELFARMQDPESQGGTIGGGTAWGHVPIDVRADDVTGIAIAVNRSVELKGTLNFADNAKMPIGLRVALTPDGGSAKIPVYQILSTRGAPVDNEGAFAISLLPEGHFRLGAVSGLPPEFYIADVLQSGASVFDSGFDITSKVPIPLQVVVSPGAATVSGIVQTPIDNGPRKTVAGATVALVPEIRRRQNRALYLSATTDAAGRYTIHGIAPGDYKVFAWESIPATAFQNAGFVARFEDRGVVIHVGQNTTGTVDLSVIPAGGRTP